MPRLRSWPTICGGIWQDEEVRARPSLAQRGKTWLGRHRRLMWSATAVLGIVVVALCVHSSRLKGEHKHVFDSTIEKSGGP